MGSAMVVFRESDHESKCDNILRSPVSRMGDDEGEWQGESYLDHANQLSRGSDTIPVTAYRLSRLSCSEAASNLYPHVPATLGVEQYNYSMRLFYGAVGASWCRSSDTVISHSTGRHITFIWPRSVLQVLRSSTERMKILINVDTVSFVLYSFLRFFVA